MIESRKSCWREIEPCWIRRGTSRVRCAGHIATTINDGGVTRCGGARDGAPARARRCGQLAEGVVAGVLQDLKAVWTSRSVINTTRIGHQWKLFFMNVPNLELKPVGGASGAVETRS